MIAIPIKFYTQFYKHCARSSARIERWPPEPKVTGSNPVGRANFMRICFAGIFFMLCTSFSASAVSALPDIGAGTRISSEQEKQLGRNWLRSNYRILKAVNDIALQSYVEELVRRIKQGPELSKYDMNILLMDNPNFNAFAVPGGVMGINLGVLQLAESEGEFASVVAHELAHLSQEHFIRRVERARTTNSAALVSVFTGIGLLLSGNIPLAALAIYGGANYQLESYLSLSRRFEREADSQATVFLRNSNFDLSEMANMFSRLNALSGNQEIAGYASTHPLTSDRVNYALLRAGQQRSQKFYTSGDYSFVRLRARAILGTLPIISGYGADGEYTRVLQLQKRNKHLQASKILESLYKDYPFSVILYCSYLESMIASGQTEKAITSINYKLRYSSREGFLYYFLALAYAKQEDYTKAAAQMEKLAAATPENPDVWLKLSFYYSKLEDKFNIFRSRSVYQLLTGAKKQMHESIQLAKEEAADNEILLVQLDNLYQRLNN